MLLCTVHCTCKLWFLLFLGLTEVHVEDGDISVGSTSGKLKAVTNSGNINANLSHHDNITLKTKEGIKMALQSNFIVLD